MQINFGPSPSSDFALAGADFVGVRSWKAMFVGIVEALSLEMEHLERRYTAL